MAIIYPSLENISRLKVKPTEGEFYLLSYLHENLDDTFEVYFNPFLDGDRPDFIILKENTAIFVIEVKDYNLDNYCVDSFNKWHVKTNRGLVRIPSPQSQAFIYKSNLYQLHLPVLGLSYLENRNFFNLVHPFVYLHKSDKTLVDDFYRSADNQIREKSKELSDQYKKNELTQEKYNQRAEQLSASKKKLSRDKSMIFGFDRIKDLAKKIQSFKPHVLFDQRVYDDLKRRLMPSEHTLKQGKKIPLDDKQVKLTISVQAKEKIKGVAGCGKTTIIASRAVNAHMRHQDKVLILTFNITLKNLIKDRISDILGYRDTQNFAVTNYHQFFSSQLNSTGQDIGDLIERFGLDNLYKRDCFQGTSVEQYQTILIDEVQDFENEWIKIICDNFLVPDGEMVLFGDESQNIYERDSEKAAIKVDGFGRWRKLKRSYRNSLDSPLNEIFKDFQSKYLISKYSDSELMETIPVQVGMNFNLLTYYTCGKDWITQSFQKIQHYINNYNLNPNDIVILSSNIFIVRRIAELFNEREKTHCMFETYHELFQLIAQYSHDYSVESLKVMKEEELRGVIKRFPLLKIDLERARRTKKNHFYANSGLIKLSTVHSFKGLESKTVFYVMDDKDTPEIIYTSITRSTENLIILDKSKEVPYLDFFKCISSD
ncbi:nuclease-related domain-containing DEAD/DEAH box helicase [Leclercia adecarboxylata]|uniref:nuclease-related domain-containing DEAD/DEAH box helicase n=1 Tax=Leclercia TaxID=83654 RepID=UPI0012BB3FF7|nr:NERD domain-containing protein/DEAD/DEAH box helicase [Leclercia adecarboxylata]QGP82913.1 AAA family ATPase [Leclercia adecarboxylata]